MENVEREMGNVERVFFEILENCPNCRASTFSVKKGLGNDIYLSCEKCGCQWIERDVGIPCDMCEKEFKASEMSEDFFCSRCEWAIGRCAVCHGELDGDSFDYNIGRGASVCPTCYKGSCGKCGKPNRYHGVSFDNDAYVLSFVCNGIDDSRRERNERKRARRALRKGN